jgi:hypothetical protein
LIKQEDKDHASSLLQQCKHGLFAYLCSGAELLTCVCAWQLAGRGGHSDGYP